MLPVVKNPGKEIRLFVRKLVVLEFLNMRVRVIAQDRRLRKYSRFMMRNPTYNPI